MNLTGHSIWISGTDRRLSYLKCFLKQRGNPVYDENALSAQERKDGKAACSLLLSGIPFRQSCTVDPKEFPNLSCLMGGLIDADTTAFCRENGICCLDYMKDPDLAAYNAIATGEGILAELLKEMPGNLSESSVIVFGFGRCGRQAASMLKALGTKVTVVARKEALAAEIEKQGMAFVPLSRCADFLSQADALINTIPARILDASLLRHIPADCPVLDIASAPGGVDYDAALSIGVHCRRLPGLPGIYSPRSSALAILRWMERI